MHYIIQKERGVTQKALSSSAWTVTLDITGITLPRVGISQESVHGFPDPESTPWSTQHPLKRSSARVWVVFVLFIHTECHGRCVCGWVKQAYGCLGKGRAASGLTLASFVLVRGLWACICFPHLTPQRDPLHRASGCTHVSAESVIRHNFIVVTYIACGFSHMVILLCSISACLFFVFPHPLHLLLAAFPAPFLQRGSYINRSL